MYSEGAVSGGLVLESEGKVSRGSRLRVGRGDVGVGVDVGVKGEGVN